MRKLNKIEAIIISEDHYNALGVIRSIGIANIKINLILTTQDESYVNCSKFVTRFSKIKLNEECILNEIMSYVINDECTYVLFPLSDFTAQLVDSKYNTFPSNVVVPNACGGLYNLSNKYFMKNIAEKCGLSVPEGITINLDENFVLTWHDYPAIIKPLISVEGKKSDITISKNKAEMLLQLNDFRKKGYRRVLIEKYIDGAESHMIEVIGCRNFDGSVDFAGIIKKIREYPIYNGSTSYAKIVDEHDDIDLEKLSSFLSEIQYVGLFDFEFKYLDNKAYFIECNFRNGAPSFVFTKCGFNLPVIWIQKNLDINFSDYSFINKNSYFMVEQNDFINMIKGNVKLKDWLIQYKKSIKIFWYSNDILPIIKYYYQFIIAQVYNILRRKDR